MTDAELLKMILPAFRVLTRDSSDGRSRTGVRWMPVQAEQCRASAYSTSEPEQRLIFQVSCDRWRPLGLQDPTRPYVRCARRPVPLTQCTYRSLWNCTYLDQ